MTEPQPPSPPPEYPYWNRVYLGVIIYTAALILALWLFSRQFD